VFSLARDWTAGVGTINVSHRDIIVTGGTDGIAWHVAANWEPEVGGDLETLAAADSRAELLQKITDRRE
jgi:hypothetical protein